MFPSHDPVATAKPGELTNITTTFGGLNTMVAWNPAAFKVMHYREFIIQNIQELTGNVDPSDDTLITSAEATVKRVRIRFGYKAKLKTMTSGWKAMDDPDVMPRDRLYCVAHVGGWNGGTSADESIRLDSNFVVNTVTL